MISKPSIIVIGLGNKYRRDDGVGLYVAEQIRMLQLRGVHVVEGVSDGAALIRIWSEADRVFVVDCAVSGQVAGYIYRFDAIEEAIPEDVFYKFSTHAISVSEAVELAKTLGEIPKSLVVYGIEGKDFSSGEGFTPAVKSSADSVAIQIVGEFNISNEKKR